MVSRTCFLLLTIALAYSIKSAQATPQYDDSLAEESVADGEISSNSYVLPKQIFNDGKPFYLEKNPVSGALDFNTKKTSGLSSPNALDPQSDKDITTNNIRTPNFHDFLNLPVKYTSSKFVYPLVSSSYANLKYQGNNKNFVSNHKNGTASDTTSGSSSSANNSNNYYSNLKKYEQYENKPYVSKAPPSTTERLTTTSVTTQSSTSKLTNPPSSSTTTTTTTTTTSTTPLPTTTTTTQELPTTNKPQFTRPPLKYTTNKYKYSTLRKRPSTETLITKEFINSTPFTTEAPSSSKVPYIPFAFRPLPPTSTFTTREPADVYSNMATTSTTSRPTTTTPTPTQKKKDPNDMSLSELFNSLLDDDEDYVAVTTVNSIETTTTTTPLEVKQPDSNSLTESSKTPTQYGGSHKYNQLSDSMTRPDQITTESTSSIPVKQNHQTNENVRKPIHITSEQNPSRNESIQQIINLQSTNNQTRDSNKTHEFNQSQDYHQIQRVQAQPVTTQNPVKNQNFSTTPENNHANVPNNPGTSDPTMFEFGIGYNVPMQPQGFTIRHTTSSPQSPPRNEITEDKLVLRPPEVSGTSIRFPVRDNFDNAPIVTGTFKNDINGHGAPPMALPQNGNGLVVFPSNRQQITATVGSNLPAVVSVDTSNLVSFGFEKPNADGPPNVINNGDNNNSPANTVKFVNIPMSPSGQPEEVFQVPIQAQINYPNAGGAPAPMPANPLSPPQLNSQETGSPRPTNNFNNRLHLTPHQKQQLHQHVIQSQRQQQLKQQQQQQQHLKQHQQQQQQQLPHVQHYPQQPNNENPQSPEFDQRLPQQQQAPPRFNNESARKPPTTNVQRPPPPPPVIGDRLLPNILPQFRPNAKIGYGQNNKDAAENQRPKPQFNNLNRRIQQNLQQRQPPPHFRRAPPPPSSAGSAPPSPNNFNTKMALGQSPPPSVVVQEELNNPNRRYFQVRPPTNNNERVYNIYNQQGAPPLMVQHPPLNQPLRRFVEGYHPIQQQQQQPQRNPNSVEENVVENPSHPYPQTVEINESHGNAQRWPQPATNDNKVENTIPKLEPVVTLQQLQHQKLLQKEGQEQLQQSNYHYTRNADTPIAVHSASDKPPVYVVYPVKTSPQKLETVVGDKAAINDAVVVGQRGEQPPLPPTDINSSNSSPGNEYQNTPFTVIRQEQKPILVVKPKLKFPYPLQRPSSDHLINIQSPSESNVDQYDETSYNIGEEPAAAASSSIGGRVVNHGPSVSSDSDEDYEMNTNKPRNTDRPIAIAYTPTEPSRYVDTSDRFSSANYASSVISEIRDGVTTQGADKSGIGYHHPHHRRPINEDTDEFGNPSRGDNYKQEFQAPFYPSVKLDKAPEGVRNSWAVVTPPSSVYASSNHNQIDRSDNDVEENARSDSPTNKVESPVTISSKLDSSSSLSSSSSGGSTAANVETSSTEPFNPDKFHPDFQGGFKPIYPPGMKHTAATDNIDIDDSITAKVMKNANIEALVYEDLGDENEESTTSNS